MKNCCEDKHEQIAALRIKQGKALKIVFAINATMFCVEFICGLISQSTALLADSLDMLGDAFVYGLSLFVLYKSALMRAKAGHLKGVIMLLLGLGVMAQAIYKVFTGIVPVYETMGIIGSLALVANLLCLTILITHKEDDINMRSIWICSRNDIIANVGILLAAFLVAQFDSFWPDVIIGTIIALLFLFSAFSVLEEANKEIHSLTP